MKRLSTKDLVHKVDAKCAVTTKLMVFAAVMFGLSSTAMAADPPINDEQSSATIVDAIGFSDTIDTTAATAAPDDTYCYGQGSTVWYSFTPERTTFISANARTGDYEPTIVAHKSGEEGLEYIACAYRFDESLGARVRFEAFEGVTYLFQVGSLFDGPGGNLTFSLIEIPPLPQIELVIDSRGSFSPRSGSAVLRGTVTCTDPMEVSLYGSLRQRAGRFFLDGNGSNSVSCNGITPWYFEVLSQAGWFAGGRADANVSALSYGEVFDDEWYDNESATVRLTGSRR